MESTDKFEGWIARECRGREILVGDEVKIRGCLEKLIPVEWYKLTAKVIAVSKYGNVTIEKDGKAIKINKNYCKIFLEKLVK